MFGTLFAGEAEARRSSGSTKQTMSFVSQTSEVEGYVLATNKCDAQSYYSLTAENLTQLKATNSIAADVPDTPTLTIIERISGHWGLGVALIMGKRKRRQQREALMGDVSRQQRAVLNIICHAAKADGDIDDSEVREVQKIASQMLEVELELDVLHQIAELTEVGLDIKAVKKMAKAVPVDMRAHVMKAVLGVVAADGNLADKEQRFIGFFAKAIKMPSDQVNALLNEVISENQQG